VAKFYCVLGSKHFHRSMQLRRVIRIHELIAELMITHVKTPFQKKGPKSSEIVVLLAFRPLSDLSRLNSPGEWETLSTPVNPGAILFAESALGAISRPSQAAHPANSAALYLSFKGKKRKN